MYEGYSPEVQALIGTLFTWAVTALGAALVLLMPGVSWSGGVAPGAAMAALHKKILDVALGFAAGVMLAASYWSLLAPAIEFAGVSGLYGGDGEYAWVPVGFGFALGAAFVYYADVLLPTPDADALAAADAATGKPAASAASSSSSRSGGSKSGGRTRGASPGPADSALARADATEAAKRAAADEVMRKRQSWRRIMLLVIAVTVHNFPEGLAVGVGFAAVGKTESATFANARNLAIGIGLQNFPEGLAVSLPLMRLGYSPWRALWYGQLSGMVEPIAGLLGAFLIDLAEPALPYALAFAAGAMIYVVVDDLVPEAHAHMKAGEKNVLASWGCVVGFIVMMCMDVGLG